MLFYGGVAISPLPPSRHTASLRAAARLFRVMPTLGHSVRYAARVRRFRGVPRHTPNVFWEESPQMPSAKEHAMRLRLCPFLIDSELIARKISRFGRIVLQIAFRNKIDERGFERRIASEKSR